MFKDRAAIVELETQRNALVDLFGSRAAEYAAANAELRAALDLANARVKELEAKIALFEVVPSG